MNQWFLGIDTSSTELGIGLLLEGKPVAAFSRYLRNSHAEHITDGISFMLKNNKIAPQDITGAGITVGPGSFTGLRIGISFFKGLFLTRQIAVHPVSSLEAIAMGWHSHKANITAALDARNDKVFAARFHRSENIIERLTEDVLMPATDFRALIHDGDIVLTDTLGYARSTVFSFLENRPEHFALERFSLQRGLAAAKCAWQAQVDGMPAVDIQKLLPRYLQESAAHRRKTSQEKY
ncbi:MAG: tRNA (adenosine(37)-N6)-threonylcarbamoyltransferase complex dimerization subunit type 1 TsaB [Chitinispirillaceae bacterium]